MDKQQARSASDELQRDIIEQFEKEVARKGVPSAMALLSIGLQVTNYSGWRACKYIASLPSLMLLADYCGAEIDMVPRIATKQRNLV